MRTSWLGGSRTKQYGSAEVFRWMSGQHWPAVLLVLIGVATYVNSLHGPFIFDDATWLDRNPYILKLWPIYNLFQAPQDNPLQGRPVISLSIAINYALGGRSVIGYHFVNVSVHILAALALMGIVRRTLELAPLNERFSLDARGLAFACALLWMVHPIQTECVNYITQRTGSFMGLFYFLTLYCAIRARNETRRRWWIAGAIVASVLGMASKEVMVTAPFMVLLHDLAFRDEPIWKILRRRWPLHTGLFATWLALAALMIYFPRKGTVGFSDKLTSWEYLKCQSLAITGYLRTIIWPDVLVLDYGFPQPYALSEVAPAGIVILILLVLTIVALILRPALGYVGAWFFVTLSPTSSFVPIVTEVAGYRRVYVPLAGIVVLFVFAVYLLIVQFVVTRVGSHKLIPHFKTRLTHSVKIRRVVAFSLLFLTAGTLACRTFLRNSQFRSTLSIWQETVDHVPNNPRAQTELGTAFYLQDKVDDAIDHYEKAIQADPEFFKAHFNLANALYFRRDQVDEAIGHYETVVRLAPHFSRGHFNLANAYASAGRIDDAIIQYEAAIETDRSNAAVHYKLAEVLIRRLRIDDAFHHFDIGVDVDPDYLESEYKLALYQFMNRRYLQAIESLRKITSVDPKHRSCHILLGVAHVELEHPHEAIQSFQAALAVDRNNEHLNNKIGQLHLGLKQYDKAIRSFESALAINSDNADTLSNLGLIHLSQGQSMDAIKYFERSLAIDKNDKTTRSKLIGEHFKLAGRLKSQKMWQEAEHHYKRSIELDVRFAKAYYELGVMLLEQGKKELAARRLREAIQIDPNVAKDAYQRLERARAG